MILKRQLNPETSSTGVFFCKLLRLLELGGTVVKYMVPMLDKKEVAGLALILGFVGAVAFSAYAVGVPLCLFHHFTGIPCPCCGVTRACVAVLRGDLIGALKLNPLAVATLFIGPFVVMFLVWRRQLPLAAVTAAKCILWPAVLLNWVYLICVAWN